MHWYFILTVTAAALFFLLIPGVGAFLVRGKWRGFRKTIDVVSRYPTLDSSSIGRERNAFIGLYRFFGTLEAIQGDDRIWITNGSYSVAADLRHTSVYLLPASTPPEADLPESDPQVVPWSRITSLPEGTTILVGGSLFSEEGRGVFRASGKTPPFVVIHDCKRENIMQRAVGSGRQRNEYWNQFTLPSLITGSFVMLLAAYLFLGYPDRKAEAVTALTLSLAPVLPFLPPGFPLYFLYRRYWKTARFMRARRDLVRLPLRFFPPIPGDKRPRRGTLLPDLEPYAMLCCAHAEPADAASHRSAGILLRCADATVEAPLETRQLDVVKPRPGKPGAASDGEAYIFGAFDYEAGHIVLKRPADPMADLVLIPGDPERISREYSEAARFHELLSAAVIAINVGVNALAVFLIIYRLIG